MIRTSRQAVGLIDASPFLSFFVFGVYINVCHGQTMRKAERSQREKK
jgi:hypothetical protein